MSRPLLSPGETSGGSPETGGPLFLAVGYLRRPHGVNGEMHMAVLTDFPERLRPGRTVYLGDNHRPAKITRVRLHNDALLITFAGYTDRTTAEELRNLLVTVRTESLPDLPEGEYYQHQLIGLRVSTDQGVELGEVSEILETGANDVLIVRLPNGSDVLLPLIDSVVLEIDLPARRMLVHLLPGLMDTPEA